MKILALVVIVLGLASCNRPMHAVWNNGKFVCPVSTAIWADQQEAQAGNDDYVYCIEVR